MSKKDNTLVKNASFLMVAALVSKIIGLIYKRPLSSMLGNEGFACFQFAQNIYFILLMIASFSIPQAVSKIMAERIAFGRYRDAQRVFRGGVNLRGDYGWCSVVVLPVRGFYTDPFQYGER